MKRKSLSTRLAELMHPGTQKLWKKRFQKVIRKYERERKA